MSSAPTEPSKRPADTDFKQQRLKAWQPILTPWWVIGTFLVVGVVFVALGQVLKTASDDVVEYSFNYDGASATGDCKGVCYGAVTGGADACDTASPTGTDRQSKCCGKRTCSHSFTVAKEMKAPIFVYYELDNFYQNHRQYVKSRADKQLQGVTGAKLAGCEPLTVDANHPNMELVPCGLIANSLFNDTFTLTATGPSASVTMSETGIAWKSDLSAKFANTAAYNTAVGTTAPFKPAPDAATCTTDRWGGNTCTCGTLATCNKYLYQSYPKITPLQAQGVKNEHFVVWMRTAGLPKFRKLYGKITTDIAADTVLTFDIDAHFPVKTFGGAKSLVISTTSWFGGKNPFLGTAYITVGAVCLVLAAAFFVKHRMNPRVLGDTSYLQWGAGGDRPHEQ